MTADARRLERLHVEIIDPPDALARAIAHRIADLIRSRAAEGRSCVLGLATGSTPVGVYGELVRLHREEGLSFRGVRTFNLDEYWPMAPDSFHAYHRFMREHLFDLVDLDPAMTHLPSGEASREQMAAMCEAYEQAIHHAGGIDLQILGIGRTGHVGFNEPGSSRDSRSGGILSSITFRR